MKSVRVASALANISVVLYRNTYVGNWAAAVILGRTESTCRRPQRSMICCTSEHHPSPPPLTGARDRSQQRAACRARAAHGGGAASPPAPSRRRSARPRPATHCVTYLHHMPPLAGAQRRPGERRPAGPRPHAARCGTALQPVLGLKTGIGARGCLAHTP
jgi:hypothetical protein